MSPLEIFDIIRRDAVDIYNEQEFKSLLQSGKQLKIKFGADPSRPDLHLGHSVPLRKLRLLQDAGHRIIFLIGDFTGMIGDPSGRNKTRQPLTFQEVRENAKTYFDQVSKFLDISKAEIVYNSDWLGKLTFSDVLELCGKVTLARVLERDDFQKRYRHNQPIGLHELLYPMMQGYDSVALECDVEVGGTDQTFNLLMARNLQKDYDQTPQVVLTFPLLPGLDGVEKMSKSLDNYIGVDESPEAMFEKCMRVPDNLLRDYFRLTSNIAPSDYASLLQSDMREAHFAYARDIVTNYHSAEAALAGEERYKSVASGGTPENIPATNLPKGEYPLWKLITEAGLAASSSEARRLCKEGGIMLGDERKLDPTEIIGSERDLLIKRGKGKFARIVFG